jgi:hypothetical protein
VTAGWLANSEASASACCIAASYAPRPLIRRAALR